jgi:hypothetical protein
MPPKSGKRRRFYRHRLLLDEQFPSKKHFPRTNSRFDVKHIVHDFHKSGLLDEEVYRFACGRERLLVTLNIKHFQGLIKEEDKTGVIGITGNLGLEQIDKRLSSLLLKSSKKELYGKLTKI